jgi:hypothetical protein
MAHEEQSNGAGISRRKLIVTGGTLAVAGAAVGVAGTSVVSSASGSPVAASEGAPGAGEPVMVYLKNADSGQFEVYVGDRHTSFADRGMAAQVIQAAQRAE